jgi:hypothetical protein
MHEGYDEWNLLKRQLNAKVNFPRPKQRQVWWCAIGLNVGSEQSCEKGFERPVLVMQVFGSMFWGLPITSSDSNENKDRNPLFYKIEGIPYATATKEYRKTLKGFVALHQLRAYDGRRLKRKILKMEIVLFEKILKKVKGLI